MQLTKQLHVRVRFEDGSYWATVDEFPGVFGAGDDLEELRESLAEGIALVLTDPGEEPPTVHLDELHAGERVSSDTAELVLA